MPPSDVALTIILFGVGVGSVVAYWAYITASMYRHRVE